MPRLAVVAGILIALVGGAAIFWRFVYGVPWTDFGPSRDVAAVRAMDEKRQKRIDPDAIEAAVVTKADYAVALSIGDVGIIATLYQRENGTWRRSDKSIDAEPCSMTAVGVPPDIAANLAWHAYHAVPTIPYWGSCPEDGDF